MAYTNDQLQNLKNMSDKYGGIWSQTFKDKVNSYQAWWYDALVNNLKTQWTTQQPAYTGNLWYTNDQVWIPWVNIMPTVNKVPTATTANVNKPTLPVLWWNTTSTTPTNTTTTPAWTTTSTPTTTNTTTQTANNWLVTSSDLNNLYSSAWVPLDTSTKSQIDKNVAEWKSAMNDYAKSYSVLKWDYEKNKWYYSNFDTVNKTFDNATNEIWQIRMNNNGQISQDQMNAIARKYGLTPDELQNPANIYKRLTPTEEWKTQLWLTWKETNITNLETDFNRKKQDLQTNIEQSKQKLTQQIDDVKQQSERERQFMEAQGALSWAFNSTWFLQWLDHQQQDLQKNLDKMNQLWEQVQHAHDTDLERITQDFTQAHDLALKNYKDTKDKTNMSFWLQLNWLSEKYWTWTEEFTKQINALRDKYNIQSNDIISKYITNLKSINDMAKDTLDYKTKELDYNNKVANERYNEYIANSGKLLGSTSMSTLISDYQNGKISYEKFKDLTWMMQTWITDTLNAMWTVTEEDSNTINHLLNAGNTPSQIVNKMKTLEKFSKKEIDKTVDLWDKTRIYYKGWTFEDVNKTKTPISVWEKSMLYDPNTWTFIQRPGETNKYIVPQWLDFIKSKEWFRNEAYWDVDWWAVWYWQHAINWKPVKQWDTITQADADNDLKNRIQTAKFNSLVKVPLNDNQKTALYDLEHNVWAWVWNFPNWKQILDAVNKWDFKWAWDIMANSWIWTTIKWTWQQNQWLINRRQEAWQLLSWTSSNIDINWISSLEDIELPEKMTLEKSNAYKYWVRMDKSNETIWKMADFFTQRSTLWQAYQENVPNILKASEQQQLEQAERDFINATLRQESWATISDPEFANARKQYFPVIWDSPEVLKQKEQNRNTAINGMLKIVWWDSEWRDLSKIREQLKQNSLSSWINPQENNWNVKNSISNKKQDWIDFINSKKNNP